MEHIGPVMDTLEVDQVGIVVSNIEKAVSLFSILWNVGPFRFLEVDAPDAILHGKPTPLRTKLAFARIGPIELELIEPGEGENIYREFLRAKGDGLHHLRITVSDIEKEVTKWKERGIGVLQSADTPRVKFAYMDTEGMIGTILELLERKQTLA
jgi:methylmalonyl-CoA/ethylmalonyl-CoA epimerase